MLAIFKKLTGGTATAADIRGALAALGIEGADAAVSKAEAARRAALIGGDERRLNEAEAALQRTRLDAERARIAHDESTVRLRDAVASEARQARDKAIAEAEKARDLAHTRLHREGAEAARKLVAVLEAVTEADRQVQAVNATLVQGNPDGRPFLDHVEPDFGRWSSGVTIPPDAERNIPGWNFQPAAFPRAKMIEGAFPPGAVGDRGDMPRAAVLRPGGASASW